MKPWEVWIAEVEFEDVPEAKKRPVVVYEDGTCFAVCFKITTQEPRDAYDYVIENFSEAGLHKESTIRLYKKMNIDKSKFFNRIGSLNAQNIADILAILNK